MSFILPKEAYRNDTVYHHFGGDHNSTIFGCGFLNKKGSECRENRCVFKHYGVVLVLSGTAEHIDEEGKVTQVYPGCVIQRIPEKHQTLNIQPDGSWLEFFFCINKSMYDALLSMNLLDARQEILYPGINRALFEECSDFLHRMKNMELNKVNLVLPDVLKLIMMLHTLHNENCTDNLDAEVIHKAALILSKSIYGYSIRELSKELGMGYEKFRKLFKEYMGVSPGNYVKVKRIEQAKLLLYERNKSIKGIAVELGFSDVFAFSKQFRNVVGVSPSEFRNNYLSRV